MAKNKEEKTNVMRTLEQKKIAYTAKTYPHGEGDAIDGVSVARAVGLEAEMVFKTLVCKGASGGYYVFDIPVAENLDLKKAVAVSAGKIGYQVVCDPKDLMALLRAGTADIIVE